MWKFPLLFVLVESILWSPSIAKHSIWQRFSQTHCICVFTLWSNCLGLLQCFSYIRTCNYRRESTLQGLGISLRNWMEVFLLHNQSKCSKSSHSKLNLFTTDGPDRPGLSKTVPDWGTQTDKRSDLIPEQLEIELEQRHFWNTLYFG